MTSVEQQLEQCSTAGGRDIMSGAFKNLLASVETGDCPYHTGRSMQSCGCFDVVDVGIGAEPMADAYADAPVRQKTVRTLKERREYRAPRA